MEITTQIVSLKDTRLPDAHLMQTENDMRQTIQVLLNTVRDLTNRVAVLEKNGGIIK